MMLRCSSHSFIFKLLGERSKESSKAAHSRFGSAEHTSLLTILILRALKDHVQVITCTCIWCLIALLGPDPLVSYPLLAMTGALQKPGLSDVQS